MSSTMSLEVQIAQLHAQLAEAQQENKNKQAQIEELQEKLQRAEEDGNQKLKMVEMEHEETMERMMKHIEELKVHAQNAPEYRGIKLRKQRESGSSDEERASSPEPTNDFDMLSSSEISMVFSDYSRRLQDGENEIRELQKTKKWIETFFNENSHLLPQMIISETKGLPKKVQELLNPDHNMEKEELSSLEWSVICHTEAQPVEIQMEHQKKEIDDLELLMGNLGCGQEDFDFMEKYLH